MEPATPVWFGEMGTCQKLDCNGNSEWFRLFVRGVLEKNPDLGWSWWPLNGTQSSGATRKYDALETYGLLTTDYNEIAAPALLDMLKAIER